LGAIEARQGDAHVDGRSFAECGPDRSAAACQTSPFLDAEDSQAIVAPCGEGIEAAPVVLDDQTEAPGIPSERD
jgi:hypothetical protein